MRAFTESSGNISPGIRLNTSASAYEQPGLRLYYSKSMDQEKIVLDDRNPPQLENGSTISDCGIIERTVGSTIQRAFIASRPGDTRALLHIFTKHYLQPYFNEGYPQTAVCIGHTVLYTYPGATGSYTEGYNYLLIFNSGDAIATREGVNSWESNSNENHIHRWDGVQFRSWKPEDYLNKVVKPWMSSAPMQAIDEAIQKANYPLLRQFLQSGPPQWREL